jgi:regulator of sigma D
MVDNVLHTRKDLQLVKGQVTAIKPKKTAKQVKEDQIGKAAFSHELKDLMGSAPSLKKVEQMIAQPVTTRTQAKALITSKL